VRQIILPISRICFSGIDLKLDYFLSKQINLFAGVDNLIDRKPADNYSGISPALDPGGPFLLRRNRLQVLSQDDAPEHREVQRGDRKNTGNREIHGQILMDTGETAGMPD